MNEEKSDALKTAGKEGWLERKSNADRIYAALVLVCAIFLAADFFYDKHAKFAIEGWFGFFAVFGFLCCFLIALAAWPLRKLLMRSEDYYDH